MMNSIKRWGAVVALLGGVMLAAPAAIAGPDEQATVDHAVGTIQDLHRDKEFGNARELMHRARAVMIAPRIFKAGFFVGGEGGTATLLVRGPGGWSAPAFYTIASATFGLQIGAQESEMILFVMSDRALQALMRDKFKVGANAGIAVATLGSNVQGATTANAGADIIVWSSSSGVYAGLTLDGSLIQPRNEANANYYGRPLSPSQIVLHRAAANPGASELIRALNHIT